MSDSEVKKMFASVQVKLDKLTKKGPAVYTNNEVKDLLGVGDKLLRKYRDEGYLGFSRIGDKYFYSEKDIVKFLELTHYDAFLED